MTASASATPRLDAVGLVMGLAFALMWSSAFTSARIVVADAPPFLALSVRFALSGAVACGIAAALGQNARLTRRQWGLVAVFGVCQNSLYLGLYFLAMTRIEAGFAAILASLMPLIVGAGAWAFFGERLGRMGALGLLLGFAGVALIMGTRVAGGADALSVGLCLIGVAALAIATLVVRGVSPGRNVLMIVGLQMLVGSVTLAPVGLIFESVADVRWTWPLAWAFLYTTLVPGVLATLVWFLLVRRIGPTRAAAFHFLNPCLGVAIAWALLGQPRGPLDYVGVAVATLGIALVQLSRGDAR